MCSIIFGPAMPPSLLTWLTMNIGISSDFARCMNALVHSRTCTILPADELIAVEVIVWIESIITISGLDFFTACIILSQLFPEASIKLLLPETPSRSARSFICLSDSSPET
ncbi:unknown [Eubacterium sp. CAG:786]|nr:unknown [Eubacterium sp. CAG:786]